MAMADLTVDLGPDDPAGGGGLRLANPVMIASGTFGYDGYGRGIPAEAPLGTLGAVLPKTLTRYARAGQPGAALVPVILPRGAGGGRNYAAQFHWPHQSGD